MVHVVTGGGGHMASLNKDCFVLVFLGRGGESRGAGRGSFTVGVWEGGGRDMSVGGRGWRYHKAFKISVILRSFVFTLRFSSLVCLREGGTASGRSGARRVLKIERKC